MVYAQEKELNYSHFYIRHISDLFLFDCILILQKIKFKKILRNRKSDMIGIGLIMLHDYQITWLWYILQFFYE